MNDTRWVIFRINADGNREWAQGTSSDRWTDEWDTRSHYDDRAYALSVLWERRCRAPGQIIKLARVRLVVKEKS